MGVRNVAIVAACPVIGPPPDPVRPGENEADEEYQRILRGYDSKSTNDQQGSDDPAPVKAPVGHKYLAELPALLGEDVPDHDGQSSHHTKHQRHGHWVKFHGVLLGRYALLGLNKQAFACYTTNVKQLVYYTEEFIFCQPCVIEPRSYSPVAKLHRVNS